ncbi:MAG: carbamoyltransferase [Verrucomicrobiia bacterium]
MNILGLSFFYHDAAAALVRDGQLVAACEQERFTRHKHDSEFPDLAIEFCLKQAGITLEQVDHIVFYEKPFLKFDRILSCALGTWPHSYKGFLKAIPIWMKDKIRLRAYIQKKLQTEKDILFCGHHMSHAASAFLVSPFEKAAIITADGVGEWDSTCIGYGEGNRLVLEKKIEFPHSVGLFYSALTAYLGFKVNDAEWKVMGLAPYGKPAYVDQFLRLVDIKPDGSFRLNMDYYAHHWSESTMLNRWERLLGQPPRKPETDLTQFHYDVARSGQAVVEKIMLGIATAVHNRYGLDDLCIGGGVGLNSVVNWKILKQGSGFKNIFIQPAAGDDGGALGAAFWVWNCVLNQPRKFSMRHAYWGPEYSDEEIGAALDRFGAKYEKLSRDRLLDETVKAIADGKVIGWFQGRQEFGPRALGNRSILANPGNPKMKDIINAKVKFREWFRPFAPSVLKEAAHIYFDMPEGFDSPYMLLVPQVRTEWRPKLAAITHEDGTGRVQTVERDIAPLYYDLIKLWGEACGVPVILNTSFNVRGEPIVTTPENAYNTFVKTGIDVLVMGSYMLRHKDQPVDFDRGMRESVSLEWSHAPAKVPTV